MLASAATASTWAAATGLTAVREAFAARCGAYRQYEIIPIIKKTFNWRAVALMCSLERMCRSTVPNKTGRRHASKDAYRCTRIWCPVVVAQLHIGTLLPGGVSTCNLLRAASGRLCCTLRYSRSQLSIECACFPSSAPSDEDLTLPC